MLPQNFTQREHVRTKKGVIPGWISEGLHRRQVCGNTKSDCLNQERDKLKMSYIQVKKKTVVATNTQYLNIFCFPYLYKKIIIYCSKKYIFFSFR